MTVLRARTLLLAVIVVLGACGRGSLSSEKVLRVGILGPFTGPAARTGAEFKGAAQMAFETVGYKIGDYKVELIWIDSQSDPQKGSTAYEEAVIRHRIDAGCLNWNSSVAVAVMEITARHRVPHFFGMGATAVVNEKYQSNPERYGYWLAKGWPIPSKLTASYVDVLEDAIQKGLWKPKSKTVAIWGEDTDWGRSMGSGLRDQLQAASWIISGEEYFQMSETDYYPLLSKFKDRRVTLLAGTSTNPAGISAFIKQAREVGIQSLIIANGLGWVGEWYSMTGAASDYVLDQIPRWSTTAARTFAADFEARWHLRPSPAAAGLAYDYTNFLIMIANRTLAKYGKIDRETLYRIGREEVIQGKLHYTNGIVMGSYRYAPETAPDPVVGQDAFIFPVLQYRGGQGKILWPPSRKESDLQVLF